MKDDCRAAVQLPRFFSLRWGSSMADTKIDPEDWRLIVERIHAGTCVPFLGAATNISRTAGVDTPEYNGLPLGAEVALRILKDRIELEADVPGDLATVIPHEKLAGSARYRELARVATSNLPRVSLLVEFGTDFPNFLALLRAILPDADRQPSPLLKTLAALPFELIVTTNYDRLMERALQALPSPRPSLCVVQPPAGFSSKKQLALQKQLAEFSSNWKQHPDAPRGVILYKIHGSFVDGAKATDEERSIIITEDDYIRFLTVLGKEKGGVPNQIKAKMTDSTLLFLGYSLEDWDFRTIFKGLIETLPPRSQRKSFAIQKDPSTFWEEFWGERKVKIYSVDLYDFADELRDRYHVYVKKLAAGQ
jgi:hypothetical protein